MSTRPSYTAERKALLSTRAELDRARLAFAWRETRSLVLPPLSPGAGARYRGTATLLVGAAAPFVGTEKLRRWLRAASFALIAYRVLRNWRR
jgi:hypothetical protein